MNLVLFRPLGQSITIAHLSLPENADAEAIAAATAKTLEHLHPKGVDWLVLRDLESAHRSTHLATMIFSHIGMDPDLDANILMIVEELMRLEMSASMLPNGVKAAYIEDFQQLVADWTTQIHRDLKLIEPIDSDDPILTVE